MREREMRQILLKAQKNFQIIKKNKKMVNELDFFLLIQNLISEFVN